MTNGLLDSVQVDDILRFQEELFDYFEAHYDQIFETIRSTHDLPAEEELDAALTEFVNQSNFK